MSQPTWVWNGYQWVPPPEEMAAPRATAAPSSAGVGQPWPGPWAETPLERGPFGWTGPGAMEPEPWRAPVTPKAPDDRLQQTVRYLDAHKGLVILPVVVIFVLLAGLAAGRIGGESAAQAPSQSTDPGAVIPGAAASSSDAAGQATITVTVVRPSGTSSIVLSGPDAAIANERRKLVRAENAGLLPAGETVSVVDGDQHQGDYVCSVNEAGLDLSIYGSARSTTCSDLTALAGDVGG